MKLFSTIKVCALAFVAVSSFVACDDDDDNNSVVKPEYVGSYEGQMTVSGEFNGRVMFSGDVTGVMQIEQLNDTLVNVTVPEITDLNAGRSIYSVKAFTIDSVAVTITNEGYTFNLDQFALEAVSCDQGDGNGFADFESKGYLKGTYKNGVINVEYTFSLGKMPFPLKSVFEGTKK
ncbi:MAG: hypothetical protein J6X31_01310 [Bacteroidales bacterium]|nr:hypothetical protein [Bacteroidales bacterium]